MPIRFLRGSIHQSNLSQLAFGPEPPLPHDDHDLTIMCQVLRPVFTELELWDTSENSVVIVSPALRHRSTK